jgi:hypothetical protein
MKACKSLNKMEVLGWENHRTIFLGWGLWDHKKSLCLGEAKQLAFVSLGW